MMKNILLLSFLALAGTVFTQATEKGDIIIDPYYGAPNFGNIVARNFPLVNNKQTSGIGPFGLRAEYMLTEKMGVGLDYIYNGFSISGTIDSANIDGSHFQTYNYKVSLGRTRVMARFNYHVVNGEKVNVYLGAGVGINVRKASVKTDMDSRAHYTGRGAILPLSARFAFGFRYYFIRNLGIQAEIGLGGPLLSAGLSFRF